MGRIPASGSGQKSEIRPHGPKLARHKTAVPPPGKRCVWFGRTANPVLAMVIVGIAPWLSRLVYSAMPAKTIISIRWREKEQDGKHREMRLQHRCSNSLSRIKDQVRRARILLDRPCVQLVANFSQCQANTSSFGANNIRRGRLTWVHAVLERETPLGSNKVLSSATSRDAVQHNLVHGHSLSQPFEFLDQDR